MVRGSAVLVAPTGPVFFTLEIAPGNRVISCVRPHPAFQGVIDARLPAIARCAEFLHHVHVKAQGYLGLAATAPAGGHDAPVV